MSHDTQVKQEDEAFDDLIEGLFTNGFGEQADRLILVKDNGGPIGGDLGGWAREPIRDRIKDYVATVRREAFKEAIAIIVGQPTQHYIYSGACPMASDTFRDNAVKAIEAVMAIERAKHERTALEASANQKGEVNG